MGLYDIGTYTAPACDAVPRSNRITGLGFIINEAKNYTAESPWLDFLGTPPAVDVADEITIIKKVRGVMDDPAWDMGAGYGVQLEQVVGGTHKYTITVQYSPANEAFMRKLLTSCPFNAGIAYVVGDKQELEVMPYSCTAKPLSNITEDIKMKRESRIELTCSAIDIPHTVVFTDPADKKDVIALFF